MVKLDLRKLSAPIESLRTDLAEAYKRLDAKWEAISEILRNLPIPTDVHFCYYSDDVHPERTANLSWKKWNAKRRICLEFVYDHHDEVHTVPYEEWSGQQRIEMLEHVPGLFKAAEKATQEFIEKTKN